MLPLPFLYCYHGYLQIKGIAIITSSSKFRKQPLKRAVNGIQSFKQKKQTLGFPVRTSIGTLQQWCHSIVLPSLREHGRGRILGLSIVGLWLQMDNLTLVLNAGVVAVDQRLSETTFFSIKKTFHSARLLPLRSAAFFKGFLASVISNTFRTVDPFKVFLSQTCFTYSTSFWFHNAVVQTMVFMSSLENGPIGYSHSLILCQ